MGFLRQVLQRVNVGAGRSLRRYPRYAIETKPLLAEGTRNREKIAAGDPASERRPERA
jgi:hypothetical protein